MSSKSNYLDVLRWVSALAVIAIHVMISTNIDMRYTLDWSIPIFVMISGVLFLNPDKHITIKQLLGRYIKRLVLTILFVSSALEIIKVLIIMKGIQIKDVIMIIVNSATGQTPPHFWFLYMILSLYVFVPFIKTFLEHTSENSLRFTIGLLFFANSLLPEFKGIFNINIIFYLPITSIYTFYFILGYLIHHRNWFAKLKFVQIISILGVCFSFLLFDNLLKTNYLSSSYNSPFIGIMAICIFLLAKKANVSLAFCSKNRNLCFIIYLIHPLVIEIILYYMNNLDGFTLFLLAFVISLLGSMFISKAQKYIKLIKNSLVKKLISD